MGGWTGSDDAESLALAGARRRAGLQLLRHGLGLRRGAQRAAAGRARAGPSGPRARRRHQGPAEEPALARAAGVRRSTTASRPTTSAQYTEKSLENLGLPRIDLLQFHVWEDAWAARRRAGSAPIDDLKREGLIRAVGISVNRWEPENVLETLRHRPGRRGAGHLQHLRPGPRGRALPALPRAGRRRDRPGAVRRGDAHRHAHPREPLARGRLAQHLLRPREPRGRASTAPRPCGRSCPPG